ncbi:hypothetical protein KFK09_028704 [Dendrobium nobile]|uniref:Uncharacterized protein n=1 Tax=Dendrobium nobile TaxID=94219 RepID=A0A8T3A2A6_DENNO|nr:hypothetical protein KFK09_028704 [Dendrobium nobile]
MHLFMLSRNFYCSSSCFFCSISKNRTNNVNSKKHASPIISKNRKIDESVKPSITLD